MQMLAARSLLHSRHDYSSIVDLGESGVLVCENFSCKLRCAFRASSLTISKSKTASKIALTVNHAQMNQKRMNRIGCSCGLSIDAKNVDPENKSTSAITSIVNIVLRRVV